MNILFLAAAEMERDSLRIETTSHPYPIEIVGVGPIEAAVGTSRAVAHHHPDLLCFIGTAGAYPGSGIEIGTIVQTDTVVFRSDSSLQGRSRMPAIMPDEAECRLQGEVILGERAADVPTVRTVCTTAITESEELAARLGREGQVENLELFGVCRGAADVPVCSLMAVSNLVGPGGGEAWRSNYPVVLARLGAMVQSHFDRTE